MQMSPAKYKVLHAFLSHDSPVKPIQISKEVGVKFPSVMMHIIGLTRMGYLDCPEKGFYILTAEGKRCMDLSEMTKEIARKLLVGDLSDRGFHFYLSLGKPLDVKAHNLQTFNRLLKTVPLASLDFHLSRGDFKAWFEGIGDLELAKKVALLREENYCGELLRRKLQILIVNRIKALAKIAGYSVVTK